MRNPSVRTSGKFSNVGFGDSAKNAKKPPKEGAEAKAGDGRLPWDPASEGAHKGIFEGLQKDYGRSPYYGSNGLLNQSRDEGS